MSVPLLSPDQAAFVDAVARRMIELLDERERPAAGLVDAASLARLLGVSRSTVYEHQDELGGVQLGSGKRSMVRFDVEQARAAWTRRDPSERSEDPDPPAPPAVRRRRQRGAGRSTADLLPVKGLTG